ncbi:rhamnogalacturonan acetylesterase [Polaribacter reichenbachii]|uniref:Rhamnogalacturonan acetylesterase n=1 Tax=Polaribacter reichenbachii TaxID=996801 RepID=A0A1B8TVK1_9FLAO|nr:rhamnogalacturonan acetylesterase [Polaribacter reichenbachii]APZ45399.1 rhamnogalacturonan acetylesterase [Polaribacter reichenbachii]AUC19260.1 rhamnogalacturonan acetylesterase [Polaribacter reichenbachii]OBY63584.1 rhamnogalacturonan acetylesterase [Polaribacter reichenbachii]
MKNFKVYFILCLIIFQSCKNTSQEEKKIEPKAITIYTIGDSTMADKPNPNENPERGWCQLFPLFLNENATLKNYAVNGRSSRSFILEKRWDTVYNQLKKGDYVFIQFGHNDQKFKAPTRYTNPHVGYRYNLIRFVEEAREKGAIPILFSSIVRRKFNEFGTLIDTHGAYPLEVRLVAQEFDVPFIDLQYLTEKLEESYGVEGSKKLHLHYLPNEIPYYPKGKEDNTHLSVLGATEISKLAVNSLKEKVSSLAAFIKK